MVNTTHALHKSGRKHKFYLVYVSWIMHGYVKYGIFDMNMCQNWWKVNLFIIIIVVPDDLWPWGVEYLMSVNANMPSPNFCTTCFTLSHSTTGPHLHQCLVFIDPRVDDRSLEACFLKSFFTLVFQLLKIDQYNSVKSLQQHCRV
jgi:hypothetical protein